MSEPPNESGPPAPAGLSGVLAAAVDGAVVASAWGIGRALASQAELLSFGAHRQVVAMLAAWAIFAAVGTGAAVVGRLALAPLGARRFAGAWIALGACLAIEAWGAEDALVESPRELFAATTLVSVAAAGSWIGRRAPILERRATWALLAVALELAFLARTTLSAPASHGAPAWALLTVLPPLVLAALALRGAARAPVAVAGLAALAAAGSWSLGGGSAEPERPSVLLVSIDTLRADHLGCYGSDVVRTPHLDRFAEEGVLFEETVSAIPETYPSHTTILTGRYPAHHGVVSNHPHAISEDVETLPEVLAGEGYRTAAFVSGFTLRRWASHLHERFQLYDDNFGPSHALVDVWFRSPEARFLSSVGKRLGFGMRVLREEGDRTGEHTVADALDWLDRNGDDPYFLFVHLFDPHAPYAAPGEYELMYDPGHPGEMRGNWYGLGPERRARVYADEREQENMLARYRGEVTYADAQVGRLLAGLAERGLDGDTLVVVTSDHGESLGEHDYWYDHSYYLYDTCLLVPLLVRLPDRSLAGTRVAEQVRLSDVAPTILDALDLEPPRGLDGRSLLPVARGEGGEAPVAVAAMFPLGFRSDKGKTTVAVRRDGWKYFRVSDWWDDEVRIAGHEELYDLEADPGETEDLSAIEGELLKELRALAREISKPWFDGGEARVAGELSATDKERLRALGYVVD